MCDKSEVIQILSCTSITSGLENKFHGEAQHMWKLTCRCKRYAQNPNYWNDDVLKKTTLLYSTHTPSHSFTCPHLSLQFLTRQVFLLSWYNFAAAIDFGATTLNFITPQRFSNVRMIYNPQNYNNLKSKLHNIVVLYYLYSARL